MARQPDQTHGLAVEVEAGVAQFDGPDAERLGRRVEDLTAGGPQRGHPAVQMWVVEVPKGGLRDGGHQDKLTARPWGEVDGRGRGGNEGGAASGSLSRGSQLRQPQLLRAWSNGSTMEVWLPPGCMKAAIAALVVRTFPLSRLPLCVAHSPYDHTTGNEPRQAPAVPGGNQ
jgi:hypothetical protein